MGETFLPQLGYRKRAHLMNTMLASLVGGKMSSSDPPNTKIMFLDGPNTVREKIAGAYCERGEIAKNGILPTLKEILIPISELWMANRRHGQGLSGGPNPFSSADAPEGTVFSVEFHANDGGGYRHYQSYDEIEHEFAERTLDPEALKNTVAGALNRLLAPIRRAYRENKAWQEIDTLAYPGEIAMTD